MCKLYKENWALVSFKAFFIYSIVNESNSYNGMQFNFKMGIIFSTLLLCCLNHWEATQTAASQCMMFVWFQTDCSLKGSCHLTPFHLSPCLYPHLLSLSSYAIFFSSLSNFNSVRVLIFKHFISLTFRWMSIYNSIMWVHLFCAWVQKTCLIAFDNKSKRLEQPYFQQYYSCEYH